MVNVHDTRRYMNSGRIPSTPGHERWGVHVEKLFKNTLTSTKIFISLCRSLGMSCSSKCPKNVSKKRLIHANSPPAVIRVTAVLGGKISTEESK